MLDGLHCPVECARDAPQGVMNISIGMINRYGALGQPCLLQPGGTRTVQEQPVGVETGQKACPMRMAYDLLQIIPQQRLASREDYLQRSKTPDLVYDRLELPSGQLFVILPVRRIGIAVLAAALAPVGQCD
jgi:hypothetical protein